MSIRRSSLVSFLHKRCSWHGNEVVHVLVRLGRLKGTDESLGKGRTSNATDYTTAKENGDYHAAVRGINACADHSASVIDQMVDIIAPIYETGQKLICAVPHPPFDDLQGDGADLVGKPLVKNALPLAYQAWISETFGADPDQTIIQKARVGRTKLGRMPRYLCQPAFDGHVDPTAAYILADDVCTMGGSLAALRSHIITHGGKVVLITTLAHSSGRSQALAISGKTWDKLSSLFGGEFATFWEGEIGHDPRCLTEAEGSGLVQWSLDEGGGRTGQFLLQHLRSRLATAAATGK